MIVSERLKTFLPQLKAANTLIDEKTMNLEEVNDDEDYIEMVQIILQGDADIESWIRSIGREEG